MPKVSFIIPVYNAEKCVSKCLESIISLSFKDWEVIIVDDGSKDSSAEICDHYAEKDSRIKVFHKCNGGVSSARNLGLSEVSGEYVTFVDSDDFVNEDYLSFFSDENVNEDVIFSSYEIINAKEQNKIPFGVVLNGKKEVVDFVSKYLYTKHIMPPWGKMFKYSIVHDLRFDESLRRGEDTKFSLMSLNKCESLRSVGDSIYYYDLPVSESKYRMNFQEATSHMKSIFEAYEATAFRNESFADGIFHIFMNSATAEIQYHPISFFFNETVRKCAEFVGKGSIKVRLTYIWYNNIVRNSISNFLREKKQTLRNL